MAFLKHLYKDLEDYLFSQDKINEILKEFRLLKIIDKKDCFKNEVMVKYLQNNVRLKGR